MTATIIPFPGRHKAKVIPIRDVTTGEYISMHNASQWEEPPAKPAGWFETAREALLRSMYSPQKPCDVE